jgi:hypothetical protein
MDTKCEVVGWLLLDDSTRVLVREQNGSISRQPASPENTFAHHSIQTGSFCRGDLGFDLRTHEMLASEL